MYNRLREFFLKLNNRETQSNLLQKEELKKKWLEYSIEKSKQYENLCHREQLKCEKLSIIISEDVLKLLEIGGTCTHDGDHWHNLFFYNDWFYFERANCFLGKFKITKFQNGCKISKFYYYNWGNKELFVELIENVILSTSLKNDLKSILFGDQENFEQEIQTFSFKNNLIDINYWKAILIGVAVSDAHGVPYEFKKRESLSNIDLSNLSGLGTHNRAKGTHSDDTALTLCLAEALYDIKLNLNEHEKLVSNSANNFVEWLYNGKWAVKKQVFDVGNTTRNAISKYKDSLEFRLQGGKDISDNGNGSLMRILPLAIYLYSANNDYRIKIVRNVSAITHSHEISIIACLYYLILAIKIIESHERDYDFSLEHIYHQTNKEFNDNFKCYFESNNIFFFNRILYGDILKISESEIKSGGFVVETLESCIWCLLNSKSFADSVKMAIKLGGDTDTTSAVTGGVSALFYGFHNIPKKWIHDLIDKKVILELANNLSEIEFRIN